MEVEQVKTPTEIMATKHSVLVIDDSLETLLLGRAVLESDGFEVLTASGGVEALQILTESEAPILILLDMQMKDMSGYEFLEMLEEKKPEIIKTVPVVFYTGTEKVPLGKASGIIHKAGDIDRFLKEVHSFINLH